MSCKVKHLKCRQQRTFGRDRDEGARQVRQVGPRGRNIFIAGVGEHPFMQILHNDLVKPNSLTCPKEVTRADNNGAHATSLKLHLHIDANFAFDSAGDLWRVFAQDSRHVFTKVVNVAWHHQRRLQCAGDFGGSFCHGQDLSLPRLVGVGRVQRMHHHRCARCCERQGRYVAQICCQPPDACVAGGFCGHFRTWAHLAEDFPACISKCLGSSQSKSASGAQHKYGGLHGAFLGKVAMPELCKALA